MLALDFRSRWWLSPVQMNNGGGRRASTLPLLLKPWLLLLYLLQSPQYTETHDNVLKETVRKLSVKTESSLVWHVLWSIVSIQLLFERIEADLFMTLICEPASAGYWIPLFLGYLVLNCFCVLRSVSSIHEQVFGTSQEKPGFPPENPGQAWGFPHVLVDLGECRPKAGTGSRAQHHLLLSEAEWKTAQV